MRSFEEINDAQTTEISKAEALKMLMEDEDNGDEKHEREKKEDGSQDSKSGGNHSREEKGRRKRCGHFITTI